MSGLYVYAIAAGPVKVRARGIFGRPVRSVPVGRLHAVVETATRAPRPSLARLKAQSRVLAATVQAGADVLPARFGTFVSHRRDLERDLKGRTTAMRKALRQVRGCVQMTIRITPAPAALSPCAGRKRPASGTAYLESLAARNDTRRNDPAVAAFASTAEPFARAARVEWRDSAATIFHLVPRTKLTRYLAAIGDTADRVEANVVLSGPFAPFAFVEVD